MMKNDWLSRIEALYDAYLLTAERSGFGWKDENTGHVSKAGFFFSSVPVSGSIPIIIGLRIPSFSIISGSFFRLSRPRIIF